MKPVIFPARAAGLALLSAACVAGCQPPEPGPAAAPTVAQARAPGPDSTTSTELPPFAAAERPRSAPPALPAKSGPEDLDLAAIEVEIDDLNAVAEALARAADEAQQATRAAEADLAAHNRTVAAARAAIRQLADRIERATGRASRGELVGEWKAQFGAKWEALLELERLTPCKEKVAAAHVRWLETVGARRAELLRGARALSAEFQGLRAETEAARAAQTVKDRGVVRRAELVRRIGHLRQRIADISAYLPPGPDLSRPGRAPVIDPDAALEQYKQRTRP